MRLFSATILLVLYCGASVAATTSVVVADTFKKDSWSITLTGDAFSSIHIINLGVNINQFTWRLFPDTYFGPTSPPFYAETDPVKNVISFASVSGQNNSVGLNKRFLVLSSVGHESFTLESKNIEVDYEGDPKWYPTSSIPEPGAIWLVCCALAVLGLRARSQAQLLGD